MTAYRDPAPSVPSCFNREWERLSSPLSSLVKRLVHAYAVPAWHGQEDEIVADIVQEAARRILERLHKIEQGKAAPIAHFEHMVLATACNYCRDLRRRDKRLTRWIPQDSCSTSREIVETADLSEL